MFSGFLGRAGLRRVLEFGLDLTAEAEHLPALERSFRSVCILVFLLLFEPKRGIIAWVGLRAGSCRVVVLRGCFVYLGSSYA